ARLRGPGSGDQDGRLPGHVLADARAQLRDARPQPPLVEGFEIARQGDILVEEGSRRIRVRVRFRDGVRGGHRLPGRPARGLLLGLLLYLLGLSLGESGPGPRTVPQDRPGALRAERAHGEAGGVLEVGEAAAVPD